MLLVAVRATCPSVHPSIHPIKSLIGHEDVARDSMKNIAKVKVTSSAFSLCTNSDFFLTEGNQVCQALGKSSLLILPHGSRNVLQEDSNLDFQRDWRDAIWLLILQIILLAFYADTYNICLSLVLSDVPNSVSSFKDFRSNPNPALSDTAHLVPDSFLCLQSTTVAPL